MTTSRRMLSKPRAPAAPCRMAWRRRSSSERFAASRSDASAASQARRKSCRAFSLSVSHSASAARACTRARKAGSEKVRASSASVETSETAEARRTSAIGSGVSPFGFLTAGFFCAAALAGVLPLHAYAHTLFHGLTGRALPLVILSVGGGLATIALLWQRRFTLARVAAVVESSASRAPKRKRSGS